MKAALIGNGPHVQARAAAIRAVAGVALAEHLPEATAAGVIQRREAALDVVFVSTSAGRRVEVAEAALRQGRDVFLEWPPAASVRELERLAERAEEAGAEVGVSRPLRFHPLFAALPGDPRAELVAVHTRFAPGTTPPWTAHLADVLDLCHVLAGAQAGPGAGVRRLDAQAVRAGGRFEAVTAGLRFHSGTYATLSAHGRLRRAGAPGQRLYAAGAGRRFEADLGGPAFRIVAERDDGQEEGPNPAATEAVPEAGAAFRDTLLRDETHAFLRALAAGEPPPVSMLDALAVLRLVEGFMKRLR